MPCFSFPLASTTSRSRCGTSQASYHSRIERCHRSKFRNSFFWFISFQTLFACPGSSQLNACQCQIDSKAIKISNERKQWKKAMEETAERKQIEARIMSDLKLFRWRKMFPSLALLYLFFGESDSWREFMQEARITLS